MGEGNNDRGDLNGFCGKEVDVKMELAVESLKCIGCRVCEYACNYHHDMDCSPNGASLMLHRAEKRNYFGMMVKREKDLLLARPEGPEVVPRGNRWRGPARAASRF